MVTSTWVLQSLHTLVGDLAVYSDGRNVPVELLVVMSVATLFRIVCLSVHPKLHLFMLVEDSKLYSMLRLTSKPQ